MSKYQMDLNRVNELLNKGINNLTHEDRLELLSIYQTPYHDSGKIKGIKSCDSSCHGCEFCQKMQKFAESQPACICGECYDAKQENRWANVLNRHKLNMRIMSEVEFTIDELRYLDISVSPLQRVKDGIPFTEQMLRENSSGDVTGDIMARNYVKIPLAHPGVNVALWAKNVGPVDRAIDEICNGHKPDNLIFVRSSVLIGIPAPHCKYSDYIFTVYPDAETLHEALKEGGCECNGRECWECGFRCYLGKWPKGANVCELLRCNEKDRPKFVEAYRRLVANLKLKAARVLHGLK